MNINLKSASKQSYKMELSRDMISIQGILSNLVKNTGQLTKLNYRGGNEDTILTVMLEIQKFLKTKNYITESNKPNDLYDKQLEDIVLFLALNTTFDKPIELEDYSHLLNVAPPISKCLLVNIIYGLDLCKYYCNVIDIFPLNLSVQLLEEVLQCLKKSTLKVQLEHTNIFLKTVANKLAKTECHSKVENDIDNICEVTNIMLFNLTGIQSGQLKNLNELKIYNHMGFCLLTLFDLLLECDHTCLSLRKFLKNILSTCCSILRNVTIDVYCAWVEIDMDDDILQRVVTNKAYLFMEKYQKFADASELIGMSGWLARKPKSLTEQIYDADVDTMIRKINKRDQDQISWFRALLRMQIFENKEAMNCVRTWSHLCNDNDVCILLNWSSQVKTEELVKIAIQCASKLTLEQLKGVTTTYFYKNEFVDLTTVDLEPSLTQILNKLKEDSGFEDGLTKNILLLFLQQPEIVLTYLYRKCLENTFYTNLLKGSFEAIQEIVKINNIGINTLLKVVQDIVPNCNNINNYLELLKHLLRINYFTNDDVLLKFLGQLLKKYHEEKLLIELDIVLQIFLEMSLNIPLTEETKELSELFLIIMNQNRCNFLNFDGLKQQIAQHSVDVCCDICQPTYCAGIQINIEDEDEFTQYYKLSITSDQEKSIFQSLCGGFNVEGYGNCVNILLKILPPAVPREWLVISQAVIHIYGTVKCMELLTDVTVLLAQLVETQNVEQNSSIFLALKFCIQNYGLVIQQKLLNNSSLETEVYVNRQICRLLAKLPSSLKEEEGISLVNILTDRSLKFLAKDKDFLCHLILIKNPKLCQVLAQKLSA